MFPSQGLRLPAVSWCIVLPDDIWLCRSCLAGNSTVFSVCMTCESALRLRMHVLACMHGWMDACMHACMDSHIFIIIPVYPSKKSISVGASLQTISLHWRRLGYLREISQNGLTDVHCGVSVRAWCGARAEVKPSRRVFCWIEPLLDRFCARFVLACSLVVQVHARRVDRLWVLGLG